MAGEERGERREDRGERREERGERREERGQRTVGKPVALTHSPPVPPTCFSPCAHTHTQADSLLCDHTPWTIHDFFDYDYVGAPWRQVSNTRSSDLNYYYLATWECPGARYLILDHLI